MKFWVDWLCIFCVSLLGESWILLLFHFARMHREVWADFQKHTLDHILFHLVYFTIREKPHCFVIKVLKRKQTEHKVKQFKNVDAVQFVRGKKIEKKKTLASPALLNEYQLKRAIIPVSERWIHNTIQKSIKNALLQRLKSVI